MIETPLAGGQSAPTLRVMVRQIRFEGSGIQSYELVDPEGGELPSFSAGAHIDVHLKNGLVRQYSLCNDPRERHRYRIAVLKDPAGRGGSAAVHDTLHVQDVIEISRPRNNFQLEDAAAKVLLLAGGIGVTPLKAMAHQLEQSGIDYTLHYCARNAGSAAFGDEFSAAEAQGRVHYHFDGGDPSRGLNIAQLLQDVTPGTYVYYCGPGGFMKACADATRHWPTGTVHFEHFKAPVSKDAAAAAIPEGACTVEIASSGQRIVVPASKSLADALNEAGVTVETSCQSGLCGTCKTRYLSGCVSHQDFILSDEEHAEYLTPCVSRGESELLVLDL